MGKHAGAVKSFGEFGAKKIAGFRLRADRRGHVDGILRAGTKKIGPKGVCDREMRAQKSPG
jgi:hypothetical protein